MTGCGNTTERRAAAVHSLVGTLALAIAVLESVIAVWHLYSVAIHVRRDKARA
jgi:hypothetical protein